MSFINDFCEDLLKTDLESFLAEKLKEFDARDASLEEVDEFMAEYNYYRND